METTGCDDVSTSIYRTTTSIIRIVSSSRRRKWRTRTGEGDKRWIGISETDDDACPASSILSDGSAGKWTTTIHGLWCSSSSSSSSTHVSYVSAPAKQRFWKRRTGQSCLSIRNGLSPCRNTRQTTTHVINLYGT